ncbi:hypothetical protein I8751_16800 [Nostocaceae cyanobacterium CENA357]|uniref:Uncharacterized protein n=1 Tax=Atlanticothrix silvestris CENA357 TaxID=1725252 RepID=A0A8J7HK13_9CYAN|nr:hypothetical protein [Atlanticothrix silvestris]MBH8553998.1 hypothetical protein [Atlanticothrix silvestris CENA357]
MNFKLYPSELQKLWFIDRYVTFLNHRSFRACPKAILEVQQRLRLHFYGLVVTWWMGGINAAQPSASGRGLEGRKIICETLEVQPPCPEDMIGSMAVVPMPAKLEHRDFIAVAQ